jgi:hypothetical protein
MKTRLFSLAGLSVLVLCRLGAAPTPEKMTGLLNNSPFGSAKSAQSAVGGNGEPFELRAVLEENGSKFFSIYDTATRRSNWVELNDPVNGFSIKSYDAAKENITVDYQGKSMTLAIKRAPAVAQVMQQPMPSVPGPNGPMVQPNMPGVQGAPTAVDQQRIQQIQEEIRRRRALRSQAVVPGTNLGGPAPAGQPNYGNGPQPTPSTSTGPVPMPSSSTGPQLVPVPPKP